MKLSDVDVDVSGLARLHVGVTHGFCCCRHVPEKSTVQKLALAYWTFHYVKRILETFFVHK